MKLHVDIVIHSYRLLTLFSSRLRLILVMGKKLVNEHFSSSSSLTKLTLLVTSMVEPSLLPEKTAL